MSCHSAIVPIAVLSCGVRAPKNGSLLRKKRGEDFVDAFLDDWGKGGVDSLAWHACKGFQSNDVAHGDDAVQHRKDDLEFLAKASSPFGVRGKELADLL